MLSAGEYDLFLSEMIGSESGCGIDVVLGEVWMVNKNLFDGHATSQLPQDTFDSDASSFDNWLPKHDIWIYFNSIMNHHKHPKVVIDS